MINSVHLKTPPRMVVSELLTSSYKELSSNELVDKMIQDLAPRGSSNPTLDQDIKDLKDLMALILHKKENEVKEIFCKQLDRNSEEFEEQQDRIKTLEAEDWV